jgi:hypothetical protein
MYPKKRLVMLLLLFIQAVVLLKNDGELLYDYYWFCDFAPAVFLIFFLFNNTQAIKGFINILLFGQLGYILIILEKVLFGITLMDFTFERPLTHTYLPFTLAIHLATLIAFLATRTYRPTKIALLYSLAILTATYSVIKIFVTPTGSDTTNYNLIFHSHLLENFTYYSQSWVILAFVFVALPTHLFQYLVSLYYTKAPQKHDAKS